MANRRNCRHSHAGQGTAHRFAVERRQVLASSAAAAHYADVNIRQTVYKLERTYQLLYGTVTLYPRANHENPGTRPAPAGHGDDIVDRRAIRARHQGHRTGIRGHSPLPALLEQTVLLQGRFDPLQLLLLFAEGGSGNDALDDELVFALLLVEPGPSEHKDLRTISGRLAHPGGIQLPEAALHLAALVPEGEIPVPTRPDFALDHLSPHPYGHERGVDQLLD